MTTSYSDYTIFQTLDKEQRQRIASSVAFIILITGVILSFAILYIAVTTRMGQLFALYAGNILFLIPAFTGYKQIQRKRTTRGIILIVAAIQAIIILLPLLFTDMGILVGLISFLMASLLITQTLDNKAARKIMPFGALGGLIATLMGYIPASFRIPAPSLLIVTIAAVALFESLVLIAGVWSQFRNFSLQTKLVVSFITLLVISLIITGGYNVAMNYRFQRAQLAANVENDLNIKRAAIIDLITAAKNDVVFLSRTGALQNYINIASTNASSVEVARARASLENDFRYFAESRRNYEQIRFLNNLGEEVVRIDTASDGVSTVVPQGELRTKASAYSFRDMTYFTQSNRLPVGEVYVSPLDLSVADNKIEIPYKPIIRFGTPVVINSQTKGVILVNMYADKLFATLAASGPGTFLADTNGYYLYHPDETKRWGQDLNTGITVNNDFPGLAAKFTGGKPGSQEIGGYLVTYTPITLPGESSPRWYLGSFVTVESSLRPILASTFTALTLLLLTMLGAIFIMTYLSNSIIAPIGQLATAARAVASGDLSARAEIQTRDEVGALATVFNDMTGQLQELVASLENRVAERTKELQIEKEQTEHRARQFEAIAKVTRAINSTQNLQELLPQISKVISEQFGFYHVGIFLNDPNNQVTVLSAANSAGGQKMLARGHQLKIGEQGIVGYVTETGRPRIALDVGDDADYFNNPDLPDTRSEMALPLISGKTVIGALDVQSTQPNAFSSADVEVLSTLADQVSLAIQNARLFDQTRKALAEAEAISRQYLREAWSRLPEDNKLAGFRYTSSGAAPIEAGRRINGGANPNEERKYIEVPIQLRGETIGRLKVQVQDPKGVKRMEMDLIRAVAERVALAAENARLFEETTRRAERERRVSDITTKIRSVNDPQQMIETAIEELRHALGATRVEVIPQRLSDMTDK
jgi:putative methionine-R-sulfoxide reductase with GAF domain